MKLMTNVNKNNYYKQMESSIGDKVKILKNIVGTDVLEIGFGSGALLSQIKQMDKKVYGLDLSPDSVFLAKQKGLENVKQGDAQNLDLLLPDQTFDTIVLCSINHEIYSYVRNEYGTVEGHKYGEKALFSVLEKCYNKLNPNGRLIIRDGIKPDKRFKTEFRLPLSDFDMLIDYLNIPHNKEYVDEFFSMKVLNGEILVTCSSEFAMEFIYTYTWGRQSFPREKQEKYGLYDTHTYVRLVEQLGFQTISTEKYIQDGYKQIVKKVGLTDYLSRQLYYPESNSVLVFQKN